MKLHDHDHTHSQHPSHNLSTDEKFQSKMAFLDHEKRKNLVSPEALIDKMPIKKDHALLDVGAGSGFFTIPMAESTTGKVYALDPDPRMIGVIQNKAESKGIKNIVPIENTLEGLGLEEESVDFVMASLVLHEVRSLSTALNQIGNVLKTGGHLLCLEYEKDEAVIVGPPMSIRIASSSLIEALEVAGFSLVEKTEIGEGVYTVLAVKG